jgi:hypothetical protein
MGVEQVPPPSILNASHPLATQKFQNSPCQRIFRNYVQYIPLRKTGMKSTMSHSNVSRGSYRQRLSDRIQTGKIVKRLQSFVFCDPETEPEKLMTSTRIQVARILLNKVLPDLKAVEVAMEANYSNDLKSISNAHLLEFLESGKEFDD